MPTYSPVAVNAANQALAYPAEPAGGVAPSPLFVFGGKIYGLFGNGATGATGVYQTADGGNTWVELDSAHAPAGSQAAVACFDGVHTIYAAYINGSGAIVLQPFDLSTLTWGVALATSADTGFSFLRGIYYRSDGSIIALLAFTTDPAIWYCIVYSGGVWGSSFSVSVNQSAVLPGWCSGVLDSLDRLHVVYQVSDFADRTSCYQLVEQDTSLGSFFIFLLALSYQPWKGLMLIDEAGDRVLVPGFTKAGTFPTVVVGTPLSAPVWSVLPALEVDQIAILPENVWTDGSDFYLTWTRDSDGVIRQGQSFDLSTWSVSTIYDPNDSNPVLATALDGRGSQGLTVFDGTQSPPVTYTLPVPVPPGPTLETVRIVLSGVKRQGVAGGRAAGSPDQGIQGGPAPGPRSPEVAIISAPNKRAM